MYESRTDQIIPLSEEFQGKHQDTYTLSGHSAWGSECIHSGTRPGSNTGERKCTYARTGWTSVSCTEHSRWKGWWPGRASASRTAKLVSDSCCRCFCCSRTDVGSLAKHAAPRGADLEPRAWRLGWDKRQRGAFRRRRERARKRRLFHVWAWRVDERYL